MKIQDIITTFKGKTFSSHEEVVEWLESSLTSLLDSIKKELPLKLNEEEPLTSEINLAYKRGHNELLEEVINIINSHR